MWLLFVTPAMLKVCLNEAFRFNEAEAALTQAEKILKQLSLMASVLDTEIEEWSVKLNLAIGRYLHFQYVIMHD